MVIERVFNGKEKLEDVLFSFLEYEIDKLLMTSYDVDRTNVTPNSEGVSE